MTPFSQPILLAISQMKDFEKFLKSPLDTCILMDFHINLLPAMMQTAHTVSDRVAEKLYFYFFVRQNHAAHNFCNISIQSYPSLLC